MKLSEAQLKLPDADPNWNWSPSQQPSWEEQLEDYKQWCALHNGRKPQKREDASGCWATKQRTDHKAKKLSKEQIKALKKAGIL